MTVRRAPAKEKPKDEAGTVQVPSVYVIDPESGDVTIYEQGQVIPAEQRKLVGAHVFAVNEQEQSHED